MILMNICISMTTLEQIINARQKANSQEEYLLDTHALLWFARNDPKLSPELFSVISNIENKIYVSYVSIWEIAIKKKIGKLNFDFTVQELCEYISLYSFSWLPIKKNHIFETMSLPLHHRDPFDRLLIAQAKSEKLTIITKDEKFGNYEVKLLW